MGKIIKQLTRKDLLFILISIGLVVVQVWLELKMPDYTQKLTADISGGTATMQSVLQNGGLMLSCAFASMFASMICTFFVSQVAGNLARTLRLRLFEKIESFSAAEMNRFSTPSLITRTTNDVMQMHMLFSIGLQLITKAPIMAIWAICKISSASLEWTTAALITVAVVLVATGSLVLICYPRFKIIQKLTDGLNNATRENISGVRVIRAFNAEEYQLDKFDKVNSDITATQLFTARLMGLLMPVMTLCLSGLTLAIYWIGAYLINAAPLLARAEVMGNMVAFTQYAMQIVMSFMLLVAVFVILPRVLVSATRIAEVLNTEPSISFPTEDVKPAARGTVEFRNVSFGYHDAGSPCLQELSFKIESGETFAIIGATGAGKTSIINLIPRFYDTSEGQILIDGIDIRNFPKKQLESRISVAPQKAVLFKGDIAYNVSYGEPAPAEDRVRRALRIAQADFALEREDAIHDEVAQGGTNFSGGQKQRLSIARAVYKDAEIVIFDDSFSALDYKTDMLVRKALKEELAQTTVIIVAQRIGTIKNADKILVLDNGRIAGIGTHSELLDNCPLYKEIALSQLSEEEL